MSRKRHRLTAVVLLAGFNLSALVWLGLVWVPDFQRRTVSRAFNTSQPPEFWWPASWRRKLRTSFVLDGGAQVNDPVSRPARGEVELESEVDGRVFRTRVDPRGRFTFGNELLPVGPFRIRLLAPDGRRSSWLRMPEIDPGRHNINWLFTLEQASPESSLRQPPA